MQEIIQELVRLIGWALVKLASAGVYKSRGSHATLFEGTLGLLVIAAGMWVGYKWWSG